MPKFRREADSSEPGSQPAATSDTAAAPAALREEEKKAPTTVPGALREDESAPASGESAAAALPAVRQSARLGLPWGDGVGALLPLAVGASAVLLVGLVVAVVRRR